MIEIIYDPYRLQQPAPGDIVLVLEEDYEPCLNSIKDSVNHGKSLTVLVINPGICGWLDHIGPKYGGVVRHIDPVQSLSVALKHSPLPEYLKKPETIIQFGLLEKAKALPPKLGENAESWGHRVLIGDLSLSEQPIGQGHAAYPPYVRQRKFADYCKKMADTIVHAVNAAYEYYGFYPLVCICSDHGYTELPEKIPVISMNTKSKSRSTNDVNSEWNPENVWKLSPEIFGLNKPMAIPFQYGCFGSKPRGASHGGCTPQEMAVPWMTFSKTKPVSLMPITVSIEGAVFRRRKENPVKVCISNPNLYAVKLLQLKIESMAIPDIFPITIGAQSVVKRDAQLDGSDISTGITSLTASASFSSSSDKMVSNSAITLNTLGSMSTEFDDDFDA